MDTCIPNLDALSGEALSEFWCHHQNGRHYRELFPDGGRGTKRATADLANYASNKAAAIGCRKSGSIERAMMYEGNADRIYQRLPQSARW